MANDRPDPAEDKAHLFIQVFEQSRFMNEVGAAIHIAPNASRILKSWGIDFEDLHAVFCNAIKVYDNTGKLIFVPVVSFCTVAFLAQFVLSLRP